MSDAKTGYFRHPSISSTHIIFVSENDIWLTERSGGTARRLSLSESQVSSPVLSTDGKWIAYSATDEGTRDVYLISAEGGSSRRLTWFGVNTLPVGFSDSGDRLYVTSNAQSGQAREMYIWSIDLTNGQCEQLPIGPAVRYVERDGLRVLQRNEQEYSRWKRYRGGRCGEIWVQSANKPWVRILADVKGNFGRPNIVDGKIIVQSDHEGHGNLYRCNPDGSELTAITFHKDFFVRTANSDGASICYQCGGDIFTLQSDKGGSKWTSTKVNLSTGSSKPQLTPRFVSPSKFLEEVDVAPENDGVLVTTRGQTFEMPLWDGATRKIGPVKPGRIRCARYLSDKKRVVYIYDGSGEEEVFVQTVFPAMDDPVKVECDFGRVTSVYASKSDSWIAVINHKAELWTLDVDSPQPVKIDQAPFHDIGQINFSPKGELLTYYVSSRRRSGNQICVANYKTGQKVEITDAVGDDFDPVFDDSGRYVYFVSSRMFDPVYDRGRFSLGFPVNDRVYGVCLDMNERSSLFTPRQPLDGPPKKDSGEEEGNDSLDLQTLAANSGDGIFELPCGEGRFNHLSFGAGKLFWLSEPVKGALGKTFLDQPSNLTLHAFDFASQKPEVIAQNVRDYGLSSDGKAMWVRSGDRLRILSAGKKPDPKESKPGKSSGFVDLNRLIVKVTPKTEFLQMYREMWRMQRDFFWTTDLSSVDWNEVYARYLPVLDKVATRSEFSDFAWEVHGELGTSHAYEMGGEYPATKTYSMGKLGVNLQHTDAGWTVQKVLQGSNWKTGEQNPARRPGSRLETGDVILQVNGESVTDLVSPESLLVNTAGKWVSLTVKRGDDNLNLDIHPVGDDFGIRYRDWVVTNREKVDELSGGRLGYLHIPDMGARGYSEFFRHLETETMKEGLVVDVRYNGGGHVSPFVLEKLAAQRLGYHVSHSSIPSPRPNWSVAGPIVAVTNEHAGSDGDIFCHCFKLMKIGTLVGKRTWGGVVGIWPRNKLVDGTLVTQPEFSNWFSDVEWQVENYGTDPDVEVVNTPDDYNQGLDRQLNEAVAIALKELERTPVVIPKFDNRPVLHPESFQ